MVKLSQKSKRIPCRKRYKIEKRIRDHNKKIQKDSKNVKKTKRNMKKTMKIPNKFPLKEEILNMAEKQREATLALKLQKKEEKKKLKLDPNLKEKRSNFQLNSTNLTDFLNQAQNKQNAFSKFSDVNPFDSIDNLKTNDRDKETSLKAFYKEFRKVVEASDVIIEVLDARDPLGSRCPQVEEMILSSGSNKKLVLLLNKIDLVPKENVQNWLKYLRNQYPTVAFKSCTQSQNERLSQSSVPVDLAKDNLLTSAKCLGADILVKLLGNYTRINDIKQTITVGIIGLPNVGKSSVINSLKRTNACLIGSTPGLTRCMKEIKLDKHIKLLDCPGIVMSKDEDPASLALKNCIKIENIEDPLSPVELLLKKCDKEQLIIRYKITEFETALDFLNLVAKRCGKVKKTGVPDINKAAHMVLNDWTSGKLTYYTQPPEASKPTDTQIVTQLGKAFDIDDLFNDETKMFDEIDDTKIVVDGFETKPASPTKINPIYNLITKQKVKEDDEEIEDDEEEEEEEKPKKNGKKTVSKQNSIKKSIHKEKEEENDDNDDDDGEESDEDTKRNKNDRQTSDKSKLKRKSCEIENDDEIYESENIPRTKKMFKMELKKKAKKEKRNDKMFNNLGELLTNVNISKSGKSSKSNELYDFKTDFKI